MKYASTFMACYLSLLERLRPSTKGIHFERVYYNLLTSKAGGWTLLQIQCVLGTEAGKNTPSKIIRARSCWDLDTG